MSRGTALAQLSELSAEQWGMFTAGQARRLGVTRVDLNRLVDDTTVELAPGAARVYRLAGSPPDHDMDALRAVWLQLGGGQFWEERASHPDAIVSHRSAAHARGLGDLIPVEHEFYVTRRQRLRRHDIRLRVRAHLKHDTWTLWNGLPVCTIEKLVGDLLDEHEDESAVSQIVRDAQHDGLLDENSLRRAVADHTDSYGRRSAGEFASTLSGVN